MKLHELRASPGATHRRKRRGRGPGSTLGKTAGRGQKGQYARSTVNRHFEGGQTPLYRRLPRRGFNNSIFKARFHVVNLAEFARRPALAAKATIGVQDLLEAGAIPDTHWPIKILSTGELKRAVQVQAHRFSRAAVEKIEAAGGKAVILEG
ncbi:MAG TPA: 50S ribosomal protein L15 [bacterium]|nr:50S ribosomal protein L15 [bacterium]